jgi:hypothetical protein
MRRVLDFLLTQSTDFSSRLCGVKMAERGPLAGRFELPMQQ